VQNQGRFLEIVISTQKNYQNSLDLTLMHGIEAKFCINFFRRDKFVINAIRYRDVFYQHPHTDKELNKRMKPKLNFEKN
jgi:hypothetical protein